ncbi:uncharacterized protein LOC130685600 [Daphnia carinata]|uniref:uncharacterized protein LOC130685600 n=1 Tax=Daphnia carinata TaxID=120202 RepID=UPI00257BDB58|nr:uncharacterized protein LOC130685600 [Daphnia carinata]
MASKSNYLWIISLLLTAIIQMADSQLASPVDAEFLPSVTASCQGGLMTIKVETKQAFQGVMHVCDRARGDCKRSPACTVYGDGNTTANLRINMLARPNDTDFCGVYINDRTSERSVPIAVRFHRTLELGDDKYYVITCGRSAFRNSRNETADAYMRLYSEDNKRVTEAVYGRKYKLRVGVNNLDSFYGFRPSSCFTYGGPNSSVIPLFDKRGCPEKKIATNFIHDNKGYAEAEIPMYRFAEYNVVNIQCDILVCNGGCGEAFCDDDVTPFAQGRAIGRDVPDSEGSLMASYSVYVVDPGAAPLAVATCSGIQPLWLLYLCIAFGILFLIMLIINVFLCSAMTCSCSKTEVIEKEPSIIEEYDPYRSWHGSQYGSRYSLNGVSKPGYISAGSTMNSTRSYSTNSDHYAIVHSRPGSRYSAPGANGVHHGQRQQNGHQNHTATQQRRDPRNGNGDVHHGPGPGSISGSHYSANGTRVH